MPGSSNTPASISWRATAEDSRARQQQQQAQQRRREEEEEAATTTGNTAGPSSSTTSANKGSFRNSTASSLAGAILPAISIGLPQSASSTSSIRTSSDGNPVDYDERSSTRSGGGGGENSSQQSLLLQPVMGNHHHSSHGNPFAIGALRQDGKMEKPKGSRKRDKLRSLSPFRHRDSLSSISKLPAVLAAGWSHHGPDRSLLSAPSIGRIKGNSNSGSSRSDTESGGESDAAEGGGIDGENGHESETDTESLKGGLPPRNTAFGKQRGGNETEEESSEEEAEDERRYTEEGEEEEDVDDPALDLDDATIDNTLYNAGCLDSHHTWEGEDYQGESKGGSSSASLIAEPEEGGFSPSTGVRVSPLDAAVPSSSSVDARDPHSRLPNVILPSSFKPNEPKRRGSKWVSSGGEGVDAYSLVGSEPQFERNRCTITLVQGDYEAAVTRRKSATGRGPKRWIVPSDGSEEASYAIEWTIGTVLRDGDEVLIVSVMETSEKLDPTHHTDSTASQGMLKEFQNIRKSMAVLLAKQAAALLQRTKLAVKISCQSLHAKHARHMLLDLIDFYEPTMVIVGSRGLGSLKGILLGSTSHYLVQKSSRPIMIARKRLQLPALPRGKTDVVSSVRRRHMRLDEAAIEKESKVGEDDDGVEGEGGESSGPSDHEGDETARSGGKSAKKAGEDTGEGSVDKEAAHQQRSGSGDADEASHKEVSEEALRGQAAVAGRTVQQSLQSAQETSPQGLHRKMRSAATISGSGDDEHDYAADHEDVGDGDGDDDDDDDDDNVDHLRGRAQKAVEEEAGELDLRGRSRSRAD